MLSEFIEKCIAKKPIVLRNVIAGELKVELGGKTFFITSNTKFTPTDLAEHQEIMQNVDIRSLIVKGHFRVE